MSSEDRLGYIEGLRGIAVGVVLVFHASIWARVTGAATEPLEVGALGVDLFFVISGFCMAWPVLELDGTMRRLAPVSFYWRRFRRIWPPYAAAVVVMLAASAAYWKLGQRAGSSLAGQTLLPTSAAHLGGDVLTHLTFLHGFIPAYDRSIDGAFWSLATEAQFYVLLPLIVLIARRLGLRVAVASMVAISIVYVLAARVLDHGFVSSRLGPDLIGFRLVEFAAGVLVAWLVRTGRGRMWGVAVLVLLGPVVVAQVHGPASAKPFAGALAFGSLVLWAARAPLGARLANLPPLRALGRISYSAYLVHGAAFMLVAIPFSHLQMSEWQRVAVFGLVGLPVAIGAATLLHRTVELRAVAWSHRRPAARSREAVSETSAVGP